MLNDNIDSTKIKYIIIACCTYKRTYSLSRTIESLGNLNLPNKIKTEILVVDNDENQSAKNIVKKYQKSLKITLRYVTERQLGLANVRNRALKEAISLNATHLAFIDDDEVADKNWLLSHVDFYNENKDISVCSGPTFSKFEKSYPKYITESHVFKKATSKKDGQTRKSCATGNVFFSLEIVKSNNIYFLKEFNYIGGEDGDFFARIYQQGYKIGWNNYAITYEFIDESRANLPWIFNRSYSNGYSGAIVKFKNDKNVLNRLYYILEKILLVPINVVIVIFSILWGITAFFNCICLTLRNLGKLIGAIGLDPVIYFKRVEV